MGFWIYMLIMILLVPALMIGFGIYCKKGGPKNVNALFGYRTTMSMKNQDTWEFAHKYCGRIWFICGWILLPITIIPFLLVYGKDIDTVSYTGLILIVMQMIVLIGSIFPTEKALKNTFDRNGNRKEPEEKE